MITRLSAFLLLCVGVQITISGVTDVLVPYSTDGSVLWPDPISVNSDVVVRYRACISWKLSGISQAFDFGLLGRD